jgi:hypothetical protein
VPAISYNDEIQPTSLFQFLFRRYQLKFKNYFNDYFSPGSFQAP